MRADDVNGDYVEVDYIEDELVIGQGPHVKDELLVDMKAHDVEERK